MQANEDACCTPAGLFKSVGVGRSLPKWLRRVSSQGADGQHVQRGGQTREAWRALPLDSACPGGRDGRGPGRPGAMGAAIGASRLPPHASCPLARRLQTRARPPRPPRRSRRALSRTLASPATAWSSTGPRPSFALGSPSSPASGAQGSAWAGPGGRHSLGCGAGATGGRRALRQQARPGSAGAKAGSEGPAEFREQQEFLERWLAEAGRPERRRLYVRRGADVLLLSAPPPPLLPPLVSLLLQRAVPAQAGLPLRDQVPPDH